MIRARTFARRLLSIGLLTAILAGFMPLQVNAAVGRMLVTASVTALNNSADQAYNDAAVYHANRGTSQETLVYL